MLLCFKCDNTFVTTDLYITHLKNVHILNNADAKTCIQNKCNKLFSRFATFKRHLESHEINSLNSKRSKVLNIFQNEKNLNIDYGHRQSICEMVPSKPSATVPETVYAPNSEESSFCINLKDALLEFSTTLYAKNSISRKDAAFVLQKLLAILKIIYNCLNNIYSLQPELISLLNCLDSAFKDIETEPKLVKNLERKLFFKHSHEIVINNEITEQIIQGNPTLHAKQRKVYVMPLLFQFRRFFELPNVLQETEANTISLLENTKISNLINGETMQNIFANKRNFDIIIPFNVYSTIFK